MSFKGNKTVGNFTLTISRPEAFACDTQHLERKRSNKLKGSYKIRCIFGGHSAVKLLDLGILGDHGERDGEIGEPGDWGIGGLGDWGIKAKVIVESCGILGDLGGS